MDWFNTIRAYWPALVVAVVSAFCMFVLAPVQSGPLAGGVFAALRWVPLAGLAFAMGYGGWVTLRLSQAERGIGHLCPRCPGPLGREKLGRYGLYRTCLCCGQHANERHYR